MSYELRSASCAVELCGLYKGAPRVYSSIVGSIGSRGGRSKGGKRGKRSPRCRHELSVCPLSVPLKWKLKLACVVEVAGGDGGRFVLALHGGSVEGLRPPQAPVPVGIAHTPHTPIPTPHAPIPTPHAHEWVLVQHAGVEPPQGAQVRDRGGGVAAH
ncbi:hypothetical protein B484DRAFT_93890 [Ochromonadaceae sp. CCMP2298]|nr:hypothetical protein B484DRAFT_93890 [Ochromonadaceae sp. CCMP2298]